MGCDDRFFANLTFNFTTDNKKTHRKPIQTNFLIENFSIFFIYLLATDFILLYLPQHNL